MPVDTGHFLAKARIRRWRNLCSGWLVIDPTKLTVYRRKFFGGLAEVASFETNCLIAVEPDATSNSVWATFVDHQGETIREVFSFSSGQGGEAVNLALSGLLRKVEEEKRRSEEEAARAKQETEEHERRILEQFAGDVWETSETVWALIKADYAMAYAVITGDWHEAKQQYSIVWQQTDKLKNAHDVELTDSLMELDEKMCAENGEEVIRQAGLFVSKLAEQVLHTDTFWAKWRTPESISSPISPNWNHVPYFLLFSVGYFETLLSKQIVDWSGVSHGLSILRSTVPVLRQCFKVDFNGLLDTAGSASAERNAGSLEEIIGRVENVVTGSFKTRLFEYTNLVPQIDGEYNGTVRE
jgi:hypothetical protein